MPLLPPRPLRCGLPCIWQDKFDKLEDWLKTGGATFPKLFMKVHPPFPLPSSALSPPFPRPLLPFPSLSLPSPLPFPSFSFPFSPPLSSPSSPFFCATRS